MQIRDDVRLVTDGPFGEAKEQIAGFFMIDTDDDERARPLVTAMASLGLPIIGDSLYPNVVDVAPGDFSRPLQLLAHRIEFDDLVTGACRVFTSGRTLEG